MKFMQRFTAMLMCIVLSASTLGCALAEGEGGAQENAPIELQLETPQPTAENPEMEEPADPPAEEPADTPANEPTEEPSEKPADEPAEQPAEEPSEEPTEESSEDPAEQPSEEPADDPAEEIPGDSEGEPQEAPDGDSAEANEQTAAIDPSQSAEASPDFRQGYAEVIGEASAYDGASPDAIALYYMERGIMYVTDRRASSDCDRLEVRFDCGGMEICAWMDARNLRPLSREEAISFAEYRSGMENVISHSGNPLDMPPVGSVITFALSLPEPTQNTPAMLVEQSEIRLGVEEKAALKVSFSDGGSYSVSYLSDNAAVAEVSSKGVVAARSVGTASIRITSELGNEAVVTVNVIPAPTGVRLTAAKTTIGVKEKLQLTPEILTEGAQGPLKFSSSKTSIAKVDENGVVTGRKAGIAKITVSTYNGEKASIKIKVKKAPSSVKITAERSVLGMGEEMQLGYKLSKGSAGSVSFTSGSSDILSVTEDGRITAVAAGKADITVKTHNGKTKTMAFEVKAAPEAILPSAAAVSVGELDSWQLGYALNSGAAGAVNFASTDHEIASVDAAGKISAHKQGSADIIITAYNGVSAACTVTVVPAPSGVSLTAEKTTIGVKEKLQLTAAVSPEGTLGTLKFSSSKSSVAKVDENGVVTGRKAGSAKITVKTYNGKTASIKVKVVKAPSSVKITAERSVLGVGEGMQLGYKLSKGSASRVSFTSSNPAALSITESGYITALAEGKADITAKTHNGKTKTMAFEAKAAPTGIAFLSDEYSLGADEKSVIPAVLSPGSAGAILFESSDSSIAAVNAKTGEVTGVKAGSAVLHARSYNGHEAACTIHVKNAPAGVSFQESKLTIAVGDSYQLLAPVVSGDNAHSAALKYSSSDKKIARVDANGVITGRKAGTAKITVKTYNGKKATLKVSVKSAPKSISFAMKELKLFVGTVYTPEVTFANKVAGNYTLASSDTSVAKVEGRSIRALAGGTAKITATSFNGKTAEFILTVPALPTSISLKPAKLTMGAGDVQSLSAAMPEGQGSALEFESSDTAVASVDAEGRVCAIAPGSAIIRVKTQNGLSSESAITVVPAPTAVRVTPHRAERSLDEGSLQLQVGFGQEGEGGRLKFESSDTAVATVSSAGLVSFKGVGTARITVSTYNGHRAACVITIGEKPGSMSFAQAEYKIALGDAISIPVRFDKGCESYSFTTGDASIAAVSSDTVRGLSLGSTTITAASRSGLTASCRITVEAAPTGISLSPASAQMTMGLNTTLQLDASVQPGGVGSVYFASSNPNIAAVDYHTGVVSAVNDGKCIITASTYDGKHSAQCEITVVKLLAGVKIGIDPGHQLKANYNKEAVAPGSKTRKAKVSTGTRGKVTHVAEHVVNLKIGKKLRDSLEAFGAEVYMTREIASVDISNQERAKMMNKLGVDLVLRVHCNGSTNSSKQGMSIYVRKSGAKQAESKSAAKKILKHMVRITGAKNRGVKYSNDYTGLNWSTVPSMLMELGYMTNPAEDRKLNDPAYQDKLVMGMVNGICEYMGREVPYQ